MRGQRSLVNIKREQVTGNSVEIFIFPIPYSSFVRPSTESRLDHQLTVG